MTEKLPDWLRRRLVQAGVMDDETGATRKARAEFCGGCGAVVMVGIDGDLAGSVATCDPTPLSPTGEALALLAGRGTFELRWIGGRYELDRRDAFRIRGSPAGTNGIDILVRHDCELSKDDSLPHSDTALKDGRKSVVITSNNPPY